MRIEADRRRSREKVYDSSPSSSDSEDDGHYHKRSKKRHRDQSSTRREDIEQARQLGDKAVIDAEKFRTSVNPPKR